ncbi:MAG: cytochrome c oxidase subunit 3 family protein [Thermoanaerobaculia bacterium]|nr:cytochrome c oxidase subunit 3 family protein [Thermoanaerobaculia bacterium]
MWAFLVQEVMFFGGLFAAYVVYRTMYSHEFVLGSRELDWRIGAINTAVLLGSSFTMVVAVWAAQHGKRKLLATGLALTILLGLVFIGVKWEFEYLPKWEHHLVPGPHFEWHGESAGKAVQIFFSLYFGMTGMHALHMVVGIVIMLFMIPMALKGKWGPNNYNFVEGFGLYWHFVDIVWIFLFPFLYLIGLSTA